MTVDSFTIQERTEALLRRIVGALIFHPDALRFERRSYTRSAIFLATPHVADAGRLVGPGGIRVTALKMLTQAIGVKNESPMDFELLNGGAGEKDPRPKYKQWQPGEVLKLLQDVCEAAFEGPVQIVPSPISEMVMHVEVFVQAKEALRSVTIENVRMEGKPFTGRMKALDGIGGAVNILFQSIAKASDKGREIKLDFIAGASAELEEQQPQSADGRFVRAERR